MPGRLLSLLNHQTSSVKLCSKELLSHLTGLAVISKAC